MAHLLDTSIVIHARDGNNIVLARLFDHRGSVAMSALSLAELERGVYKRPSLTADRLPRLEAIIGELPILAFDLDAARAYGRIIAQCGWVKGRDFDRMIAAHALSTGSVLVTNNTADFSDIPDLTLENWTTA